MSISFQRVYPGDRHLLKLSYRLRYRVYCLECNFEDPDDHSDEMEYDEYDPHSIHFVALDNFQVIGTVRLVMNSPIGFPLERHCDVQPGKTRYDRRGLAEVSRLAVGKSWRCSDVSLGLMRAVYQESKKIGIFYWYAAMERKLERLLRQLNVKFIQIGNVTHYHGPRIPYLGSVNEIESFVFLRNPQRFSYFQDGLPLH
ncbi:MAG: GNAT family N-acetyltransferase [Deltaproteobacteria bacterium]|nr:GNAT family N-acetyltransferase [Deltaproteobacteria bacterium]